LLRSRAPPVPPPRHSVRFRPFSSLSASRHRRRQHQELLAGLQLPRRVLQSRQFRDQLRAEGGVHARRQSIEPSANNNNNNNPLLDAQCMQHLALSHSRLIALFPFPSLSITPPHKPRRCCCSAPLFSSTSCIFVTICQHATEPLNLAPTSPLLRVKRHNDRHRAGFSR
jgi:hypothetical protein